jgi:6-pyruvoyltetrahydropterin/6-carboxytetrahydropterin synthase
MITATRYHDISTGHRVYGHESKCAHLHGHNYRIHFTCAADELDEVGRVIDFSVIKSALCMWVENNWDHKFLLWTKDPLFNMLYLSDPEGVVGVNFNPTAENMAEYLVYTIGPQVLPHSVKLVEVTIEETMKCRVTCKKGMNHYKYIVNNDVRDSLDPLRSQ